MFWVCYMIICRRYCSIEAWSTMVWVFFVIGRKKVAARARPFMLLLPKMAIGFCKIHKQQWDDRIDRKLSSKPY